MAERSLGHRIVAGKLEWFDEAGNVVPHNEDSGLPPELEGERGKPHDEISPYYGDLKAMAERLQEKP